MKDSGQAGDGMPSPRIVGANRRRLRVGLRRLVLPGVVMVLFWLAAQFASGIPPLQVLATSVDGLLLADYRQDPLQTLGMAPLSARIYSDAYRDALSGQRGVSWVWFGAPAGSGRLVAAAPLANTPSVSPAPSATATSATPPSGPITSPPPSWAGSSPTPTANGSPLPSPGASGTPTPTAPGSITPSASPTPAPTPTPSPTPAPTVASTTNGTFTGLVKDWNTNLAIPNEVVSLNGGPTVLTDLGGSFSESVPAGTYLLTVSGGPYATQMQSITIKAGSQTPANIWMVPGAQAGILQGTVTDSATGVPIVGAYVYINVPGLALYTDGNGRCTFTGLPAGGKTVTASAANYNTANQSSSVTAGGVTTLNIKLVHR